ncbi:MAG: ATP--guanido phosphotransferase [Puniceicoccales bacterium]|jgi:protein arginine kinase|nr:ATP--guanido phosphotransferase [Puniceicoccales bacterium]
MEMIKTLLLEYSKRFAERSEAIVVSTRIRLARNFSKFKFPSSADDVERVEILNFSKHYVQKLKDFKVFIDLSTLTKPEQLALQERRVISKELLEKKEGVGVICSDKTLASIMINEEDHLRIQVISNGFQLRDTWKKINEIDNAIDDYHYAFSPSMGYLTACPSNVGTGMRASVMMHLPGLELTEQIQYLIDAVQQIGITVRGVQGEGSKALGHMYQISNQQTLGIREADEIQRLEHVTKTIMDQEMSARDALLKHNRTQFLDKIGRIYGILRSCYALTGEEAFEMLAWMRLAADYGIIDEKNRSGIDRYSVESQPGNLVVLYSKNLSPEERDIIRAENMRIFFKKIKDPQFDAKF